MEQQEPQEALQAAAVQQTTKGEAHSTQAAAQAGAGSSSAAAVGSKARLAGAGAIVAVILAALGYLVGADKGALFPKDVADVLPQKPEQAEPEPPSVTPGAPEAQDGAQGQADVSGPDQGADEQAAIAPPSITTWAVAGDGVATIAGLAQSGADVQILLDGQPIDQTKATRGGEFALVTQLPPNPNPSFMMLRMVLADGQSFLSAEGVALGPISGPVIAETITAPETQSNAEAGAVASPAAVLVSQEGAVVLQSPLEHTGAALGAADNALSLAAITYTPEGEVQLSGLATALADLHIYIDNALHHQTQVAASGQWVTTLPPLQAGRYVLRIDQMDKDGTVSARLETPFERETLAHLALAAGGDVGLENATSQPSLSEPSLSEPQAQEGAPQAPKAPVSITVQPGHSLWAIARDQLGDGVLYVKVLQANQDLIRDPDLIYPGQVFSLPSVQ